MTFAPGVLSQQVQVSVTGDTAVESNETFTLTLSNPVSATIADGSALGTITNDDVAVPGNVSLSISDASVIEGDPGTGVAPGWFSTSGNQIVDSAGNPVQIAGVNWFGMETRHLRAARPVDAQLQGHDGPDGGAGLQHDPPAVLERDACTPPGRRNGIDFSKNPDLQG